MLHQSAAHVVGTIPRIAAEALQQADDEARKRDGLARLRAGPAGCLWEHGRGWSSDASGR